MVSAERQAIWVLVVEHETDPSAHVAEMLALRGYGVVTVRDGESALRQMDQGCPGALIVDLGDVGRGGVELVRSVRDRYGHDVPIVGVTWDPTLYQPGLD